jgi:hypothetical protein
MQIRDFAVFAGLLAIMACDEKSPPLENQSPHIAGKKSSTSVLSGIAEESVERGKTKSSERRKDAVKKSPVAEPAQGQPGKVISPFTGQPVDVTGKMPGDLVGDPKFPGDESKMFVVPEGVEPVKPGLPVARSVPGKAGFVFSPHSNQIIDVTGLPPGSLVADPTYPAEEKKHFRIPGDPQPAVLDPTKSNVPLITPEGNIIEIPHE